MTLDVVQPALDIVNLTTSLTTLSPDAAFQVRIGIPNAQNTAMSTELAIRAGGTPLTATVVVDEPEIARLVTTAVTGAAVSVTIGPQQARSPSNVAGGGVALDPLTDGTVIVSATIPGLITLPTASQTRTITTSGITLQNAGVVGSGLQRQPTFSSQLGASDHGGVTVRITSSDPEVALIAPNNSTPGTEFIDVNVNAGATGFTYWVQGVESATGPVTITAQAPGFQDATVTLDVVQPALDIVGLATSLTTLSPDDPFQVRIGIPNAQNTALTTELAIRAGGVARTATVTVNDETVGRLVTSTVVGPTVTVAINPQQARSPTTVAAGGVAFDPLTGGEVTVSATIPDFLAVATASQSRTITTPGITLQSVGQVGSGLQRPPTFSSQLGASDHGGVTVRITSSNPDVALVAPNNTTPGAAFIDIPVNAGATAFTYWVQALDGQNGTVAITASAPGFTDGNTTADIVAPALDITGLSLSLTNQSPVNNFTVRVGIPSGSGVTALQRRAGADPLVASVTTTPLSVGRLVTSTETGSPVTVQIQPGASSSPSTVANGGVGFEPLDAGVATVNATIEGFAQTTNATREVQVDSASINLNATVTASGLQRSVSGALGASGHGGTTVTLVSNNPSVLLLSPNATTEGTASIEIPINAGATGFTYVVHGVEGAQGEVQVTASSPGFMDGTVLHVVEEPALDITNLTLSLTTTSPDNTFRVRVGLRNATESAVQTALVVRAGAAPLTVTITNGTATVGELVTTDLTGQSVTVAIVPGQSISPASVGTGGVAFRPLGEGASVVQATIPGFFQTDAGRPTVNVSN